MLRRSGDGFACTGREGSPRNPSCLIRRDRFDSLTDVSSVSGTGIKTALLSAYFSAGLFEV